MAELLTVFDDEYLPLPGDPIPEDEDYDRIWKFRVDQARQNMDRQDLSKLPYCTLSGRLLLDALSGDSRGVILPAERMSTEELAQYDRDIEEWINDTASWDIENRRVYIREEDPLGRYEMEKPILPREVYFTAPSPRQRHVDERFHKTIEAVDLVQKLMRRQAETGNVHLLVAAPECGVDAIEMQEWISIKEVHFYEALMDWVIASNPGDYYQRVPVSSSLEITEHYETREDFNVLSNVVYDLFNTNPELREAVYSSVPNQMRHRKHRDSDLQALFLKYKEAHETDPSLTLTDLLTKGRKPYAPLDKAIESCRYVLFQISLVLLVGTKKLGPKNEDRYDQVTLRFKAEVIDALSSLKGDYSQLIKRVSGFDVGDYIPSNVRVPYGSVPEKKAGDSNVISLVSKTSRWTMAGRTPNQVITRGVQELKELETDLWLADIGGLGSDVTDDITSRASKIHDVLRNASYVLFRRHQIEERRLDRDTERNDLIFKRMAERAKRSPRSTPISRMVVAGSIYDTAAEQELFSRSQAPYWMQAVLLRRTGLQSAASSAIQGPHVIQRRFSEWLPVTLKPKPDEMNRGEFLLQATKELLHGNTEIEGALNNRSPLDYSIQKNAKMRHTWFRNQLVRWEIDYFTFHDAIFNVHYDDGTYSGGALQSGLFEQRLREENHDFEQSKWCHLNHIFNLFDGPFKPIYDNYMHEIVRLEEARADDKERKLGYRPASRSKAVIPKTSPLPKRPDLVGSTEAYELYMYVIHNLMLNGRFQVFVYNALEEMLGEIPPYGDHNAWLDWMSAEDTDA